MDWQGKADKPAQCGLTGAAGIHSIPLRDNCTPGSARNIPVLIFLSGFCFGAPVSRCFSYFDILHFRGDVLLSTRHVTVTLGVCASLQWCSRRNGRRIEEELLAAAMSLPSLEGHFEFDITPNGTLEELYKISTKMIIN
jgi:hypothetical protein